MGKVKSIIQSDEKCYICGYIGDLETHHCWHGSNRKKADEDGLTVRLCRLCHSNLHDKGIKDRYLMEIAEKAYLSHYNKSIGDFIDRYGKNVI